MTEVLDALMLKIEEKFGPWLTYEACKIQISKARFSKIDSGADI